MIAIFLLSVQFSCSVMSNSLQPHALSTPGFSVLHSLPEFVQTQVHWVNDAIQPSFLCCPLLLPSIFSSVRVFFSELALHIRWPKYWSFSFNISPSNEYSELISFRIDWFDRLAVQGDSQESSPAPQFKSINCLNIVSHFSHQFLHLCKTTGKTIALTIRTFVSKVMSLLFNTLFRFVIGVLARSKRLLISRLQSLSSV